MIKRGFFSLRKPRLKHLLVEGIAEEVKELPVPDQVTLFVKDCDVRMIGLNIGDSVKTGQRLNLTHDPNGYVMSTVTGKVSGIREYTGYLSQNYAAISIDVTSEDQWDEGTLGAVKEPTHEVACSYLGSLPGKSDFLSLLQPLPPVNTVIINCMDADLLVLTNRLMVKSNAKGLIEGIEYLKKVAKISRVVLTVSPDLVSLVDQAGAIVKVLDPVYPNTLPQMIARSVLDAEYMPDRSFEEMGIGFIGAEAIISLSGLFGKGVYPIDKTITVIGKDGLAVMVKARIGTPVKDIFEFLGIEALQGDRIVFGGPMTGKAIYSLDMPVSYDTDAIMIQDKDQIMLTTDGQCVNCGECVRACPAEVPVNMLVRVLSNGLYGEAVEAYDLFSCIECGLCDYVCIARIPIFHYIMLGKHEFVRLKSAEGSNE